MENIESIEYFINEEENLDGVYAVSLVSQPAIESEWIMLSKQDVQMKLIDKKKGLLCGAALIPNKEILRKGKNGNPDYKIWFSKDTIRKTSELFFKNSHHKDTTLEHQVDLQNNVVVESWIKESATMDKSVLFELDAPVGSWIITMKIHDPKILELAKAGEITGFSIEGLYGDETDLSEVQKLINEIDELINNVK